MTNLLMKCCIFKDKLKQLNYLLFILPFLSIPTLSAHPHSWISVFTEIEGDNKEITGLKMFWTFDLITTSYTLDGADLSKKNRVHTLNALSNDMLKTLLENNYFTYIQYQGKSIEFQQTAKAKLTLKKYKLTLEFLLKFKKPLRLPIKDLQLQIYEKTYFVDFLWLKDNDLQLGENFTGKCQLDIIEPTPSSKQILYASSLEIDKKPNLNLGRIFTQSLILNCQKSEYE